MDQFDCVASEATRKLSVCGLGAVLTIPISGILLRLDTVLANLTTVCGEVIEGASLDNKSDALIAYGYDFFGGNGASMEAAIVQSESASSELDRRRKVCFSERMLYLLVQPILELCFENEICLVKPGSRT